MAGMSHLILWLAMMAVFIYGFIGIVRLANKLWAVSTALGWAVLIVRCSSLRRLSGREINSSNIWVSQRIYCPYVGISTRNEESSDGGRSFLFCICFKYIVPALTHTPRESPCLVRVFV
jgi:hypothetical protein